MAEPVPMEELYAEYAAMRRELFDLADQLPDGHDLKVAIIESDKNIQAAKEGRDDKVKECHPDGVHWPPHPECPCCQKVAETWDAQAKKRCKELGLEETDENLLTALKDFLASRK